ncbi:hypothetical protein [Paraburkholderia tropica]|uniref:hypothetical protein n=1 Tax=Paraburkholderia tropica TaxID=92647 RepID=UPI002AB5E368|nr:hypothetical protein [Paraburkholderia tropica]
MPTTDIGAMTGSAALLSLEVGGADSGSAARASGVTASAVISTASTARTGAASGRARDVKRCGSARCVPDARVPTTPARGGRCWVFMLSIQLKEMVVHARRHRDAQQGDGI